MPPLLHAPDETLRHGMKVDVVSDKLAVHRRVQSRPHQPRRAMMEGHHAVKKMRHMVDPVLQNGPARRIIIGGAVS